MTLLPETVAEEEAGVLMFRPSRSPKLLVLVIVELLIVALLLSS
ncbi:hypothetical protein V5O39_09735 [Pseudomonas parakoreensis]|jgi:hypothetical protein